MTKHLQLSSLLEHIQAEVPDVRAAVLASRDGLAMASTIDGAESSRIAAMAATVHGVGHRVAETAELGDLVETVIRSDELTFVVYDAGTPAVLALLAKGDCNLGLVHLEGRRSAVALCELLTVPEAPTVEPDTDQSDDVDAPHESDDVEAADDIESSVGDDAADDASDESTADDSDVDASDSTQAATDERAIDEDEEDEINRTFAPPPPPPGFISHTTARVETTSPNGYGDAPGDHLGDHEHATP